MVGMVYFWTPLVEIDGWLETRFVSTHTPLSVQELRVYHIVIVIVAG